MIHIEVNRVNGDYGFEAKDAAGHIARMDTSPETGGENFGIRPMQMLLMGLGGCSGIDIVSILKKQRQPVEGFRMLIDGEREAGKEPSLWTNIHIIFELKGDVDPDKAYKACALSIDKYCSVAATLKAANASITWEVKVAPSDKQQASS
ncbi:OsmC family protein [Flavitalea sp. BT771]|uniref:OsmC family protein n=1 Tax=Flavitalea sp. BT771 TaxID=3063329 RepID=UPI0026E21F0F|nr:OsmC family protein [Flavitalea sp. BT771]MDO6431812.1 OsmC family protein [Flavitalea sp. BT771]MDV6220721.1 OsmC family protein [Flavitalea sp. BT771]